MKLRLLPIAVSLVASASVLFGGWFLYHSVAMENPLQSKVSAVEGVKHADIKIGSGSVDLTLKLEPDANLREVYHSIVTEGASIIGTRKVNVVIDESSSPELDRWWSKALFDVAEAMETKHYATIPEDLQRFAGSDPGLKVETDMDEANVYIRLSDGKAHKSIILERTPLRIGVWPND